MKPSTSDVVVIGGGLSGLAAATYLARTGLHTTLVEKAPTLGGRASTEIPQGFALNRGAHALYSGGPASEVLKDLNVTYKFGSPRKLLARDASGLHPFPTSAMDLLRTDVLGAADKAEFMAIMARLATLRAASLAQISTQSWIVQTAHRQKVRHLLEAVARVSLYTAGIDLASADVFVDRLQQSLKHPVHYVEGGWQTLVDGLRRAAQSAGTEILDSCSAASISIQNGHAAQVRLHNGRTLACSSVVVATPPEDAAQLVPSVAQTLANLVPAHVACLDLALRRLPVPRNAVIFDLEEPRFLTAQSEFARLAPEGAAVVHLLAHLHPEQTGDAHAERAALQALLDETQPGWRDEVVEQRFLPRMLASAALPLAGRGGMAGRPAPRCPGLDNVYFAGDWVGPEGYLADAALASARATARLVLDQIGQPALAAA
jgi:phytoene dehydrogenase-like protein